MADDQEYCEKYQEQLEIAVENCYLLFDPKKSQSKEALFKWIEAEPNDRMIVFQFIVNTCELVGQLEPPHVIAVSQYYRIMTDEQLKFYGDLIKNEFYQSIDIRKSGCLQKIWSLLICDCIAKAEVAQGLDTNVNDLRDIVHGINSLTLKEPTSNEEIAQEIKSDQI